MTAPTHCADCGVALTAGNRAAGDELAGFCRGCWDQKPPWRPFCRDCGLSLVQDGARLFCPALCSGGEVRLEAEN